MNMYQQPPPWQQQPNYQQPQQDYGAKIVAIVFLILALMLNIFALFPFLGFFIGLIEFVCLFIVLIAVILM